MTDITFENFFFIVGRPRSGTTLLRTLLDAHPNVLVPLESPVILDLSFKYSKKNFLDDGVKYQFVEDLYSVRKFSSWNINKDELHTLMKQSKEIVNFNTALQTVFLSYKSIFPKENILLLGDKNPVSSMYLKRLVKLFPRSKYIYIIRDYRDNFISIRRTGLNNFPAVAPIVYRWVLSYKTLLKLKETNKYSIHTIRYEDLVKEPEAHMKAICNFLNINYEPVIFDFYKETAKFKETPNLSHEKFSKFHNNITNPVNTNRINLWKNELTDKEIKIADMVAGKYAGTAGYEREFQDSTGKFFIKIFFAIFYIHLQLGIRNITDHLPMNIKASIRKTKILTRIFKPFFKK